MAEFIVPKKESMNFPGQMDDASWAYKNKTQFIQNIYLKRLKMVMSIADTSFGKVLDLGTGCGILLPSISKISENVYAGDIVLENAQFLCKNEGMKNVEITGMDAINIPFKDGAFDAIFCVSVLEHIDLSKAIPEIKRVLKKGGYLFIGIPVEAFFTKLAWFMTGVLEDAKRAHINDYKQIRKFLEAEFDIVKKEKMPRFMPDSFSLYEVIKCRAR